MAMAKSYAADAKESSAIDFVAADVRRLKYESESENELSQPRHLIARLDEALKSIPEIRMSLLTSAARGFRLAAVRFCVRLQDGLLTGLRPWPSPAPPLREGTNSLFHGNGGNQFLVAADVRRLK